MFEFKASPQASWQVAFRMMFSAVKGTVNIMYENDSKICQPWDSKPACDWDRIFGDYCLSITGDGKLVGVDVGSPTDPDIVSNWDFTEDNPTLVDCFLFSLRDHYRMEGTHHPKLHPSWYADVEGYKPSWE